MYIIMYTAPYRCMLTHRHILIHIQGSIVTAIATEVAGGPRGVKIRIRGIGSGFIEGTTELQQPLHFNVSAESSDMLVRAVEQVKPLVATVKGELAAGSQQQQQQQYAPPPPVPMFNR